jgi:hypothetical protein
MVHLENSRSLVVRSSGWLGGTGGTSIHGGELCDKFRAGGRLPVVECDMGRIASDHPGPDHVGRPG